MRDDGHRRQEPRQAGERRRAGELAFHLAQKDLLAHDAGEVAVLVVAEAHPVERLRAVQALVAGIDVDRRVARDGGVVVVAAVDHEVRAAELVDDLLEAVEVDVDEVVDGHAQQALGDLEREPGAAERVGGVDLVRTVAGDRDQQVARHREHGDAARLGVEPHEQHRVGARAQVGLSRAAIAAQHQDGERLAGLCRGELRPGGLDLLRVVAGDLRGRALQPADQGASRDRDKAHHGDHEDLGDAQPQRAAPAGRPGCGVAGVGGHCGVPL